MQATRRWNGRTLIDDLAARGILIRSPSWRGVAEEAPLAYKDVGAVVEAPDHAGLAGRWPGSRRWSASRARGAVG